MAFTFATFCYIIATILSCFPLFFAIFKITAFDELKSKQLKSEYKNPIDLCSILNSLVLPEYITHFSLTLLFLCSGEWLTFFFNVPLVVYHVKKYKNRSIMSRPGLYNPTRIMNKRNLKYAFKEEICKAVFYFLSFIYYLVRMYCALYNHKQAKQTLF